jgi:hypothetical protein
MLIIIQQTAPLTNLQAKRTINSFSSIQKVSTLGIYLKSHANINNQIKEAAPR